MAWDELQVLKSLPSHPNVIPFSQVVIEEVESQVIRLTTKYTPGKISTTQTGLSFSSTYSSSPVSSTF